MTSCLSLLGRFVGEGVSGSWALVYAMCKAVRRARCVGDEAANAEARATLCVMKNLCIRESK